VHAALAHYYRDREAYDQEIAREREFNTATALREETFSLPRVKDAG
jgi:hypothetical protein